MSKLEFQGTIGTSKILQEVFNEFTKDAENGKFDVAFAGYAINLKEYHVQINLGSNGYSSDWPEWAYNIAREAFLYNKRLWVIYKEVPFGRNLMHVLLIN
jgi:hypothetical protein